MCLRVLYIPWFEFWISHQLAICWAERCRFLRNFEMSKVIHKSSIYGMKVWQFWCNVIWKFVEDLFTYQKVPFKNFCDLQFSHKLRNCEFFLWDCCTFFMGWEIKIDMGGQSNDCLRVNYVKKWKKFYQGRNRAHFWECMGYDLNFFHGITGDHHSSCCRHISGNIK